MVRDHISRPVSPGPHKGAGVRPTLRVGFLPSVVRSEHCLVREEGSACPPSHGANARKRDVVSVNENRQTEGNFIHKTMRSSLGTKERSDRDNLRLRPLPV